MMRRDFDESNKAFDKTIYCLIKTNYNAISYVREYWWAWFMDLSIGARGVGERQFRNLDYMVLEDLSKWIGDVDDASTHEGTHLTDAEVQYMINDARAVFEGLMGFCKEKLEKQRDELVDIYVKNRTEYNAGKACGIEEALDTIDRVIERGDKNGH